MSEDTVSYRCLWDKRGGGLERKRQVVKRLGVNDGVILIIHMDATRESECYWYDEFRCPVNMMKIK